MVAPVVLIAFNRPAVTREALHRLREARPEQVFLIVDGPRADREDDFELCRQVREVLAEIDWPCTVHRRYADFNLGCAANIELGLDWVFESVTSAIILEDDCLPDLTFFDFCSELLTRYEADERVSFIGGVGPDLGPDCFGPYDYTFAAFASIWGWATWRRSWEAHRAVFDRKHGSDGDAPVRAASADWGRTLLLTARARSYFRSAEEKTHQLATTWAIHWTISSLASRKLAIAPAQPLLVNAGFGDGTHTLNTREMPTVKPLSGPLRHPPNVVLNEKVEQSYEALIVKEHGAAARWARRLLPEGRVRNAVRQIHYRRTTPP